MPEFLSGCIFYLCYLSQLPLLLLLLLPLLLLVLLKAFKSPARPFFAKSLICRWHLLIDGVTVGQKQREREKGRVSGLLNPSECASIIAVAARRANVKRAL